MSRIQFTHTYENIISVENLLEAWQEFLCGKRMKQDVLDFQSRLFTNISLLHQELATKTYKTSGYEAFRISDPKPRNIHKALVRDKLLHHAIYRILYRFFDRTFIADSYSCRMRKGTHRAMDRFRLFAGQVSENHTRTVWVLKCDVRRFFDSIDHVILKQILARYISDQNILWLLSEIIDSFDSKTGGRGVGLPLGNLTSQLFVNIYMNEFDQFMKHRVKAKHYIRYADDFVIFSEDKKWLEEVVLPDIEDFLLIRLRLRLHPDKVFIKTVASGVDFLGWVHFSTHRVLRTSTKRRMMKAIEKDVSKQALSSYVGLLSYGNEHELRETVEFYQTVKIC